MARRGYRRLQRQQAQEANRSTQALLHDVADAVIELRTAAEGLEKALGEMDNE